MINTCGCCTGIEVAVPVSEVNSPGLSALNYRIGTFATFFETMLARLTGFVLNVPSISGSGEDSLTPLARLTTRDPSDPSIALMDAWATVADVLTFYQERIANEGYLPTALQRRSLLELARLVGYRLRPGVSASVQLAFTVASGFEGTIPAGTRAQSIPGAGQKPQFFETSADMEARDVWNSLAPRLGRPQLITPPKNQVAGVDQIDVTGAEVVDAIYADGLATGLTNGDAVLFSFGTDPSQQQLRYVESIDAQAPQSRTQVTLVPPPLQQHGTPITTLEPFLGKAKYLFPGSDIVKRIAQLLGVVIVNLDHVSWDAAADVLRGALPDVALQNGIANSRGFTRVAAFVGHLFETMQALVAALAGTKGRSRPIAFKPLPITLEASPLANLGAIVDKLALPASVQPANSLRLSRSIAQSFSPQSDMAPRLLATLKPAASATLYQAWQGIAAPTQAVQALAFRAKTGLFASTYPGPTTATQGSDSQGDITYTTSYTSPTIASAWQYRLVPPWSPDLASGLFDTPPTAVALNATYEQIKVGSWVAVERPTLDDQGNVADTVGTTTYHLVTSTNTVTMDTTTGFSAKVTVLQLEPRWLADLTTDPQNLQAFQTFITTPQALCATVVHAQSEPLNLADEPLDTDIEGSSIDLDEVYDGLEPGRTIIVSGTRTDVPNTTGVVANERAMIAAVAQGSQAPFSVPFPLTSSPFGNVFYTTGADAYGDRLVVGMLADPQLFARQGLQSLPLPAVPNQQYDDQVELAVGTYANAYVPTGDERDGKFPTFEGLLVSPYTNQSYPGGIIASVDLENGVFAWRISSDKLHTILSLANALAYTYDRSSITIYGNVTDATNGQSVGEVLGNGNAAQPFQNFTLSQSPLTFVSAATPSGISSSLTVQVNDLNWHEVDDFLEAAPSQRSYIVRENDVQQSSVTFGNGKYGARLPTGTANVKALYRYGMGSGGNVDAAQISQLVTHPLGAQGVVNPLPATGGADPDTVDRARVNIPISVMALDRLVSVQDYAEFALAYAGIGKASAVRLSDGQQQLVFVTIAGAEDIPISPSSDLFKNLLLSLQTYGDPYVPIRLALRRVRLLVMSAVVGLQPDYIWEDVVPSVRSAILALFAFDARSLAQTAFLSEAIRAAQDVEGVAFVNVTTFDGVPENVTAPQLASLSKTLRLRQFVRAESARINLTEPHGSPLRIVPDELVFMTPDIPDTLILTQAAK